MEGLRNFIEVGYLKEGTRPFLVQRPRSEEGGLEVSISEGPEEIDAESRRSWDHIAQDRWRPPLVDADWHAFCQAIYKGGIQGRDWEGNWTSTARK